MCDAKSKVTLSELILAAVCHLQEKNGVTACEIAKFIAEKRGCELDQIAGMIKLILCQAKTKGILSEKNGKYKIKGKYDDPEPQKKDQVSLEEEEGSDEDEDEEEEEMDGEEEDEGEEDEDEDGNDSQDPCKCLKLSRECLSEEDENRCGEKKCPKKRKCK